MNDAIIVPILAGQNLEQNDKARLMGTLFAMIIASGVFFGNYFINDNNLTHTKQEVAQIVSGVRALYVGQPSFSGLNDNIVIMSGILNKNKITSNNTISTPYGGNISIRPSIADQSAFDVIITGLGNNACAKLATGLTAHSVTSDCKDGPKQNIIKLFFRNN